MLTVIMVAAFGALLAACAGGKTASAESTASSPATTTAAPVTTAAGSAPSATTTTRLPPIIHRGVTLLPPSRSRPVPLVIALHGMGATPATFAGQTGFNAAADRFGFVVAYLDSPLPSWKSPSNITYISAIISTLKTAENIDPQRVYVAGFSLGGYATYQSACELSGQVAAIAVVSNAMVSLTHRPCDITRPLSELNIVGSDDLFPVHATPSSPISADHTAKDWRTLDGCSGQSHTTDVGPTVQTVWNQCIGGSAVGEYIVEGGVHTWPGSLRSGADAHYSATYAIVAFFGSHPGSTTRFSSSRYTKPVKKPRLTGKLVSVSERVNGNRRSVRVTIKLSAASKLLATLSGHGRRVTWKRSKLPKGNRDALVLNVPLATPSARYSLKLALSGASGTHLTLQRQIRVPAAGP